MNVDQDSDLARIREVSIRISDELHNDPKLFVEHYIELQKRHRDRLVYSSEAGLSGRPDTPLDHERA